MPDPVAKTDRQLGFSNEKLEMYGPSDPAHENRRGELRLDQYDIPGLEVPAVRHFRRQPHSGDLRGIGQGVDEVVRELVRAVGQVGVPAVGALDGRPRSSVREPAGTLTPSVSVVLRVIDQLERQLSPSAARKNRQHPRPVVAHAHREHAPEAPRSPSPVR